MDAVEKIEGEEVEIEKVEVEKNVKKPRKPLGEAALERLAKAREKANRVRKELAQERQAEKESLVQQKMEEVQEARQQKDQTAAVKEAKKRVRAKRESIIIERESSGSSSEDDIRDARVYTVRKSRSSTEQAEPSTAKLVLQEDPLAGMYKSFFAGTRSIF
jgi:hypothetical protein